MPKITQKAKTGLVHLSYVTGARSIQESWQNKSGKTNGQAEAINEIKIKECVGPMATTFLSEDQN